MKRKVTTLLIAMVVNVLLITTKFFLARLSGSIALRASAWHSFADVFVSLVVLAGIVVAERRRAGKSSSGISRIEHGVSLFVSVFVFYMGYRVFADVIGGHEHDLMNVGWVAAGAVLTIAFAYFMGRYKTYVGRAAESPALVADGMHSMMDVYSSTVVLAGLLGYLIGFRSLDKVAAVLVALFIFSAGYHIFRSAVTGLGSEADHPEHRFPFSTRLSRRTLALLALVLVAGWALSGFFLVQPDEQAVVRRFGRRITVGIGPGLGYRLPWPIDDVTRVKVTQVRQLGPVATELLTGDENLVRLEFNVHYTVADVSRFLFDVAEPATLVRADADAAIRQTVGERGIDELLTSGRAQAEERASSLLQASLDAHQAGVRVEAVRLLKVMPPEPVAAAFLDVASAREDKATYINEAAAYANEIVPKARGEAQKTVKAAEAYRATKIGKASGDADRFVERHVSHQGATQITEARLYLESVESALSKVRKYLISPDLKGSNLDFWFMGANSNLPPFVPPAQPGGSQPGAAKP